MEPQRLALILIGVMCGLVLACIFLGAAIALYGHRMDQLVKEFRIARRNTPNPEG